MSSIGEILDFFESLRRCGGDRAELLKRFGGERLYIVGVARQGEALYEHIALSRGEAEAYAAYTTRRRRPVKHYALELQPPDEAQIRATTLADVLADEARSRRLKERIEALPPLDTAALERLPKEARLLWHFEDKVPACIPADARRIYQEIYPGRLPEGIDYGDAAVADEKGRFGLITNRTRLLGGVPDLAWVFGCRYAFVRTEGGLAELHESSRDAEAPLAHRLCTVADTEEGRVYSRKALAFSLGYFGEFVEAEADGRLRYVRVERARHEALRSRPYASIVRTYPPAAVQCAENGRWGYIDKAGREIIPCRYDDWGFFNDGYAVVKEGERPTVIDEKGRSVIPPRYRTIEHYRQSYFFVQNDAGEWALFCRDKIAVDFVDISTVTELPRRYDSLFDDFSEIDYRTVLISRLREQERQKHALRYTLPLAEYLALFDPPGGLGDLERMGLLYHPVRVRALPEGYETVVDSQKSAFIGWEYPSGAAMFDMRRELPVMLQKRDGTTLVLGIALEDLELVRISMDPLSL